MNDGRGATPDADRQGTVRYDARPNLTPSEASDYLRAKFGIRRGVKTLAKLRCISSDGPVFVRVGRNVLYPQEGLDSYGERSISAPMRSTSDTSSNRSNPQNLAA